MKILMVIPQLFYSSRGTPLSAFHRIRDLIGFGHEVDVVTYGPGEAPPELAIKVHRARGPHFRSTIKQGPSLLKIWFDLLLLVEFFRVLRREKYDLVYAHEEGAFLSALVCPLLRVPFVYDMHSSLPLQIRDWNFSDKEWVVSLFRFVERFALKRACAAVAISPAVAAAARESCPGARVVTILNRFVLDEKATPEQARRLRDSLDLRPEHRVVLYAGTFVPLQALDLLVDAMPRVLAACPEARFVLVGGTKERIDVLARQAEKLGVREALVLIESRPQAEMPVFQLAADVLVSPRVKGINPPGKLFSYLDSGKPVVATDRPIHTQILQPGFSILTPPTPDGLADGILSALTDRNRVRDVTTRAREALMTLYGPEQRAKAYETLLGYIEESPERLRRRNLGKTTSRVVLPPT